jgi:hypothetical protein
MGHGGNNKRNKISNGLPECTTARECTVIGSLHRPENSWSLYRYTHICGYIDIQIDRYSYKLHNRGATKIRLPPWIT